MKVTKLEHYLKSKREKNERKFLPKEVIFLLFLVLLFISGIIYYKNEKYYKKLSQERYSLLEKYQLYQKNYLLKEKQMRQLLHKEGIENYARQQYNFLKPGEILVMPQKENNPPFPKNN